MQASDPGRKLYKARRPDGEMAWVDHDELWRLQQSQAEELRRKQARRRGIAVAALIGLVVVLLAGTAYRLWLPAAAPAPGEAASSPLPVAAEPAAAPPAAAADSRNAAAAAENGNPAAAAESGGLPAAAVSESPAGGPVATAAPAAEAAAGSPPPAAGPAADAGPPPGESERVEGAVRAWAEAWGRRDVPAYLASYAEGFEPPDGLTRRQWASLRRRRLLDRASIRVEIQNLEIELRDSGRAEARFRQAYSSPSYSDVVRKTLELIEDGGEWRIVAERAAVP